MVTAGELAAMQEVQQATLTETCAVVRRTLASDGAGGQTVTSASTTTVCRLVASRTQSDRLVAGSVAEQVLWRITLPAGTDVGETDAVTIGSRTFEVMGVYGPATRQTALVCVCVER